jgi:hypothetical protein
MPVNHGRYLGMALGQLAGVHVARGAKHKGEAGIAVRLHFADKPVGL